MLRAHLSQDLDAVEVGQPQVDQDQVRSDLVGELQTLLARGSHVHFDVLLAEHARDERADVAFVVDHEDRIHAQTIVAEQAPR